jgi:hypothetical protein
LNNNAGTSTGGGGWNTAGETPTERYIFIFHTDSYSPILSVLYTINLIILDGFNRQKECSHNI